MKRNLIIALVAFLVLGFAGLSFGELFEKSEVNIIKGMKWAPGEIIVKFKRGISQDVIRQINQRHGTSVLSISKRGQFKRLKIPRNKTVEEMVAIYSRNPNVEYAEPNFIVHAIMIPNDPYYSYQWHMDNSVYGGIHMESAWDITTGDPNVIVAVIDTGVAYEDYKASPREKYYLAPDLGETLFVPGYDFVNNDSHPNDDNSHGTHVAGTIAQSTNNNLGVTGVAFETSIMPVKVLDRNGSGTVANVADGIYFAADSGAAVINLSLGGTSPSTTIENAVAYAYKKGVTIVCAAGNEYQEGSPPVYPAAYDAYCIAVGATRFDETRSYYSNTGSYLDIASPGGDLNVDQNGDGYGDGVLQQTFNPNNKKTNDFGYWFFQGTSMASPHVAGVAALLIANGVTGSDNVRDALESTAEDKGAVGWDEEYGWGIVDAYAALNYSPEPVHDVAVTNIEAPSWVLQGDNVSVVVNVANQGDYEESFIVTLNDKTDEVLIGTESVFLLPAEGTKDLTFDWDTTGASLGDHILEAVADTVPGETDTADNSMTTTVTINEKTAYTMHVASIDMALSTRIAGRNKFTKALAAVTIVDADNNPVEGATVYGSWSGATSDTDSGVTDATGKVTLESDEVKNAPSSMTFTFTVDDVVKSGWTYDSASITETSNSVIVK